MMKTSACKILLSTLLLFQGMAASGYSDHRHHKVDSLEQILKSGERLSDEQRMDIYKSLMWGYQPIDGKQAVAYAHKALDLAYRHPWLNTRADALRVLGLMAYGGERYEEAEHYFMEALAVTDSMRIEAKYEESDVDDNYSALYGSLGNLYNIQDQNLLAIEYYQKAEPIFEKYGWKESLTILHHNIGELYLSMGNREKAEAEYLQGIESGEASGDSLLMSLPRKGLVKVYIEQNDYDKALQTITPAYHYYRTHADEEPGDYGDVLASMVKVNLMEGHEDLAKAKALAKDALKVAEHELMAETRFDIFAAAAMVEMRQGNWQQALAYAKQSVHENDEEATFSDIGCYELLANISMQLGHKDEASRYIKKVRTMMERFATHHYQSGLSQMEVLYETEKKQEAIEQLTRQRQWFLWGGILTAALLLLTAFTFFLLWRSVRLSRRSALIKAKLDGEVDERSRIARDLHDGLGGMLSLLRLKTESDAPKAERMKLLDETATELRHVAHHLMPEQLLKRGLTTALHDLAVSVPGGRFQHIGSEERLNSDIEVVLYRCAYELVNNAIKHARATHIDLQLMQQKDEVTLTVSDDGQGIADTSQGTGLQNIRERIGHYKGTMTIVTAGEQGTEININLPI